MQAPQGTSAEASTIRDPGPAAQQSKQDRKRARKEAKRLAASQGQVNSQSARKQKKRERSNSDADVQDLLVPSAPTNGASVNGVKRKIREQDEAPAPNAAEQKHLQKKRKTSEGLSALDTLAEAALVHAAANAQADPNETPKERKRRHREERRQAAVAAEAKGEVIETEAARKIRKAEKKERKRLAAETRRARSPSEQPRASTSKIAYTSPEDEEAMFAAATAPPPRKLTLTLKAPQEVAVSDPKGKGKAKEVIPDEQSSEAEEEPSPKPKRKRAPIVRKDNEELEAEWQKVGASDPGKQLSSKWMSLALVRALAAEHNFKYRQGAFSNSEERRITAALKAYRLQHGLSEAELKSVILTDRRTRRTDQNNVGVDLWVTLAQAVGGRPVLAVYNHVKRAFDPQAKAGDWSAEEDATLRAAYLELGSQWTKVGHRVGRNPTDCKDRYTKHLEPKVQGGKRKMGPWERTEELKLRDLVEIHGKNWIVIEKQMDGRTATQCRIKWRDTLVKHDGIRALWAANAARAAQTTADSEEEEEEEAVMPRFSSRNRSTLIHCINDQNVPDASEINFKDIGDETIQAYGPDNLKDRWRRLQRRAKKELSAITGEDVDFQDIMIHLMELYPERGGTSAKRKRGSKSKKASSSSTSRKFKSAETIETSDEEEEEKSATDNESD